MKPYGKQIKALYEGMPNLCDPIDKLIG